MGSKLSEENLKLIREKFKNISERGEAFWKAFDKCDAEAMVCLFLTEEVAHIDTLTKSELIDDVNLRLDLMERSFEARKVIEDILNGPVGKEVQARYGSRIFQGS